MSEAIRGFGVISSTLLVPVCTRVRTKPLNPETSRQGGLPRRGQRQELIYTNFVSEPRSLMSALGRETPGRDKHELCRDGGLAMGVVRECVRACVCVLG